MNSAKSSATTMLAVLTMRWIVSGKRASGTTRKTRPFYKNTFAHHTNMSEKRKIVLDTNCLIASLSRRGQYYPVCTALFPFNPALNSDTPKEILNSPKVFSITAVVSFVTCLR